VITHDAEKDSLNYWYQPDIKVDSLIFKVSNINFIDTLTVKIKDQEKDSLLLKSIQSRPLKLTEDFELQANIPFQNIDESKVTILDKDSTTVVFSTNLDALKNVYKFNFDKTEENNYRIQMLPETFTDFFGNKNDTLNFTVRTKALSDYGDIRVTLRNATYPVIVQLVSQQDNVEAEKFHDNNTPIDFLSITPGKYYLRVIFDTNGNKKYDAGNYLKKQQPERVSYYPEELDIRAYSEQVYEFILK
jgi:hypothetical protein